MATTASGVTIPGTSPTTTAATPIQDHWNNLGKSLNGRIVVPVASVTARAALVSALTAEGYTISASNPLYTHRADAGVGRELEVTVNGTAWRTTAALDPAVFANGPAQVGGFSASTPLIIAPAIIADGARSYRVTGFIRGASGTVVTDLCALSLVEVNSGASISGPVTLLFSAAGGGYYSAGVTIAVPHTPAAGQRVYRLDGERSVGTGQMTAYNPKIIVEQIA